MKRLFGSLLVVAMLVLSAGVGCATFGTPFPVDHEARVTGIESQAAD